MDKPAPPGLLYPDEVFQIQGAAFAVSNGMGAGFLEGVYQECLAIESRDVRFRSAPHQN